MRRLLRTSTSSVVSWAFNGAAVVSAVLSVGVCVLWVRGYWTGDFFQGETSWWKWYLDSSYGVVGLVAWHYPETSEARQFSHSVHVAGPPETPYEPPNDPGVHRRWQGLGFYWFVTDGGELRSPGTVTSFTQRREFRIPYWFATLLFAFIPAARFSQWHRERRRRSRRTGTRCPSCGYDLRATPGRCPECGAVPGEAGRLERAGHR